MNLASPVAEIGTTFDPLSPISDLRSPILAPVALFQPFRFFHLSAFSSPAPALNPVAAVYDRRPLSAFSPREGEATSPGSVHDRRPRSGNRNDFRPPISDLRSPIFCRTAASPALKTEPLKTENSPPFPFRHPSPVLGGSASPLSPISYLLSPGAKRPSAPLSPISYLLSSKRRAAAFTLIELLVVIAIIGILAGLVLAAMGDITKRGARAKAESEIQALSAAIEEWRHHHPGFPRTNSNALFAELTSDLNNGVTPSNTTKVFFEPPPGIVGTNGSQKFFQDPWGAPYEYTTNSAGFFEILSRGGTTNSNQWIRN